jgi:predicted XRE-type DNA-binding protein
MATVFIAGSITISHLHEKVQQRISKIVSSNLHVVVGDADGADTAIQKYLNDCGANNVTVYCSGATPRNNVADWPVHRVHSNARAGSRAFFVAKDLEMARCSDYGLMVWDCQSTGTLSNVIELLTERKKSVVFVNKNKDFVTITDKASLDQLLLFMADRARAKAEAKIGLAAKLAALKQEQLFVDPSIASTSSPPQIDETDIAPEPQAIASDSTKLESMKLRLELMSILKEYIDRTHLSQSQAARIFGVTQPRISDLTRGKVDLFGLDSLVNMAATAGLRVELTIRDVN